VGCRRRSTPPSLRFLGRRVYLEAVVLIASIFGLGDSPAKQLRRRTGVPARTVRRWLSWWQTTFVSTSIFIALQARTVGKVSIAQLPLSMLELFERNSPEATLQVTSRYLAPLTTRNGSRASLSGVV
jgi:hypothetical protein